MKEIGYMLQALAMKMATYTMGSKKLRKTRREKQQNWTKMWSMHDPEQEEESLISMNGWCLGEEKKSTLTFLLLITSAPSLGIFAIFSQTSLSSLHLSYSFQFISHIYQRKWVPHSISVGGGGPLLEIVQKPAVFFPNSNSGRINGT